MARLLLLALAACALLAGVSGAESRAAGKAYKPQKVAAKTNAQDALGAKLSPVQRAEVFRAVGKACECDKAESDDCGCCAHVDIKSLGINDEVCVNITCEFYDLSTVHGCGHCDCVSSVTLLWLLPQDIPATVSLSITLSLDGKVILNETESALDPDVCVPIPVLDKLIDVCVKFFDMNVSKTHVSGCVKVEFTVLGFTVATVELGCFSVSYLCTRLWWFFSVCFWRVSDPATAQFNVPGPLGNAPAKLHNSADPTADPTPIDVANIMAKKLDALRAEARRR
jgi:Domain of unknown function (DUF4773)